MHKVFHPDVVKQIPQEYQYAYYLISNNIIPTLNFKKSDEKYDNPLQELKDRINKYQERKRHMDENQLNNMINESIKEYKAKEKEYYLNIQRKDKISDLNDDELMTIIINTASNYYNQNTNKVTDYFKLFNIDNSLSTKDILDSDRYKKLLSTFGKNNISRIDDYYKTIYPTLIDLFNEFDISVLHGDRVNYEKILQRNIPNQYELTIKGLVSDYLNNYRMKPFLNFYELFKIDSSKSVDEIKNDTYTKYLNEVLDENNAKDIDNPKEQRAFLELCQLYKNFMKKTLSNIVNKNNYDESIKDKDVNTYRYKYEENEGKSFLLYSKLREIFYKTLEHSLSKYGATKTVISFTESLQNNDLNILPKDIKKDFKDIKINDINKLLLHDYGKKSNPYEWIELSIDNIITDRINLFKDVVNKTYEKYNYDQVKTAIEEYINNFDVSYFTRGENNYKGKELLIRNINPGMLKIIIGSLLQDELGFLVDDVNNEYDIRYNKGLVEELLNNLLEDKVYEEGFKK